jgi:hypothetical protein
LRKASPELVAAQRRENLDGSPIVGGEAVPQKEPALGSYGLRTDDTLGMPWALADFGRLYMVHTKSLLEKVENPHRVVASLVPTEQEKLAIAFAAHLLRAGPGISRLATRKLSQLWTAGGNAAALKALHASGEWGDQAKARAASSLGKVIAEAWTLGVPIFNLIDDAVLKGQAPDESLKLVVESLREMERFSRDAIDLFEAAGYVDSSEPGHGEVR